jgi:hypothetical protein
MRRGFAACNIADFRAGVGLRRYFGLRGPVEKFRSMEFDLSSRDADCRLRRRDNGGSLPPIVRGCVFPFWALDSCGWDAQGGQSRQTGGLRNNPRAGQAISKHLYGTITYDQYSITVACYLCNTHPKTVCRVPFRAVPLLRVHGASVIVMLRRRGASRGRPVLGGSLKSLAFMRECPKARSG